MTNSVFDKDAMNLSSNLSKLCSGLVPAFSARLLAFTMAKKNKNRESFSGISTNDEMRNTNTSYGEPNNVERGYRCCIRVIVRVAGYEPLRQLSHLVHLTFVLAFLVLGICGTRAGKVGSIQEAKSNLLQLTFSARC